MNYDRRSSISSPEDNNKIAFTNYKQSYQKEKKRKGKVEEGIQGG